MKCFVIMPFGSDKKDNKTKKEVLYRFQGQTGDRFFAVQIKEDLKRKQKFFISLFECK